MKNKENKPLSPNLKQLSELSSHANIHPQKGEAMLTVFKLDTDVHYRWSGTKTNLLHMIYTVMQNDMRMATIFCRVAKDYIETCKSDPNKWMTLTNEINNFFNFKESEETK